tara:strand:- start:173 stop:553 length:381 start_codon:yes stop_codon:yes gene_type:complete
MTVKRIEMAMHVQELCAAHDITVKYQSLNDEVPRYYAQPQSRVIQIRPTKNTGYYVSALHEIGHIIGERQGPSISTLTKELYAWIWARQNALVWTDTAERIMRCAMDSYGWTNRQKDIWNRRFATV